MSELPIALELDEIRHLLAGGRTTTWLLRLARVV